MSESEIFSGTLTFTKPPEWEWSVFGKNSDGTNLMIVYVHSRPPFWKRLIMRFFLGSKWRRK